MGEFLMSFSVHHVDPLLQEQVQTNKDLDLPTQQELLAQFRCDEIATVALEEFNMQAKSQRRPIESGRVVEGLGAMMSAWVKVAFGKSRAKCSNSCKLCARAV